MDKVSIYLQNIINVLPWKHLQVAEAYTVLKSKASSEFKCLIVYSDQVVDKVSVYRNIIHVLPWVPQ